MVTRRVLMTVLASASEKLVIVVIQLLLVPILAFHWGAPVYGCWLLLFTIPSFLGFSDFGFAGAAGNEMTMLLANDRRDETLSVFQSGLVVVVISACVMVAGGAVVVALVPGATLPTASGFSPTEARSTLAVAILYGVIALQGATFYNAFRATGLFALGVWLVTATLILENVAVIVIVLTGGRPLQAAIAFLGVRMTLLVVQALILRRKVPWLRLGTSAASLREMRALLPPALAMMSLPLAQAVFLQGTAVAVGIALSAAAVPLFTSARTLSRIGLQLTQLINVAIMPEYSAAVARDDRPGQASFLAMTLLLAAVVIVPFALILAIWGQDIVILWTAGTIRPTRGLMMAMAATVVLGGIWNPLSNLILAMNRHATFTYPYAGLAVMTIPLTLGLTRALGVAGAGVAMAMLDLAMCVIIFRLARQLFVTRAETAAAFFTLRARIRLILDQRRNRAA